jgi:ABC-type multidrug transport system permease subunit
LHVYINPVFLIFVICMSVFAVYYTYVALSCERPFTC